VLALTALSLPLALSEVLILWLLSQALLAIAFLQWFILLHDFGHGIFFKSQAANWFWGSIASIFCLVPFSQWKHMHQQHHQHLEQQDLDPTRDSHPPTNLQKKFRNFAWKWWLPLYSLRYSLKNLWNIPRLFRIFPSSNVRIHFLISLIFMQLFFLIIAPAIPSLLTTWLPAYVLFLVGVDVLLYSQYELLKVTKTESPHRNLEFPHWITKYILLNFNNHVEHYLHPEIPCYLLKPTSSNSSVDKADLSWILKTKRG